MSNNETKSTEPNGADEQRVQLLSSQPIPKELNNWMTNISIKLQDIPIWKQYSPRLRGTHSQTVGQQRAAAQTAVSRDVIYFR